jgi:hypothetical protein
MELSPSWEAVSCTSTQEYPKLLWNPNFHYRVPKIPPLIPVVNQINPIHTTASYRSKIHLNIILPPTSWSSYSSSVTPSDPKRTIMRARTLKEEWWCVGKKDIKESEEKKGVKLGKAKPRGRSPQANYTDRATAAYRRS